MLPNFVRLGKCGRLQFCELGMTKQYHFTQFGVPRIKTVWELNKGSVLHKNFLSSTRVWVSHFSSRKIWEFKFPLPPCFLKPLFFLACSATVNKPLQFDCIAIAYKKKSSQKGKCIAIDCCVDSATTRLAFRMLGRLSLFCRRSTREELKCSSHPPLSNKRHRVIYPHPFHFDNQPHIINLQLVVGNQLLAISQKITGNQPDHQCHFFIEGNQPGGLDASARLLICPSWYSSFYHYNIRPLFLGNMVWFTASNPHSVVDPSWIIWSRNKLGQGFAPKQVSILLFMS